MVYEVVMPQLSDSMEEGKLVSWKVSVAQRVKSGDVIAEVESDKAIMEVQTFQDGIIKELLVQEGNEVKVGSVIARIETNKDASQDIKPPKTPQETKQPTPQKKEIPTKKEAPKKPQKEHHNIHTTQKGISPKAKKQLASLEIDVQDIQAKIPKQVLHTKDVEGYLKERYFTPKAQKLLEKYQLEYLVFSLDHKIDSYEVQEYINANKIMLQKPLSSMQKAIIANVTNAAQKPIFHIYETIDATYFQAHQEHSITAWLVKIFAKVMMCYEGFRSQLVNDMLVIAPNASLSIAVADEKNLYMPVIQDANQKTISQITQELVLFKEKLKTKSFTAKDMQGATFGISNLGMLGIARFDAMINANESGIVAVGGMSDGKIELTLTIDHRLINGYEAALFIQNIKKEVCESLNFKE
ncbi:Dihydrolipoamide acetyltransferase component of pyruvate dehydrogenase complex [hydrothermal vent metagenome]|uniref:Dihydrolipoamide acetyltransferase component of pyruvate dehydrogenase complex n=1 Tax=hydrothermal vent metagenome TaxID=652676 RepID=A0A1W1D2U3_9ZZZZ